MKVKFSRCNSSDLSSITITDGQLIFVKDTNENYIDVGTSRNKISDVVFVDDEDELSKITSPLQNKLYLIKSTNDIQLYNGSTFKSVLDLSDLQEQITENATNIANKVDKEDGKSLSTNDYTTAEKTKLAGIEENATANDDSTIVTNVEVPGSYITLTKADGTTTQVRGFEITSVNASSRWCHLGTFYLNVDGYVGNLWIYGGQGYNARVNQNAWIHIMVKKGYQSTSSTTNIFGATYEIFVPNGCASNYSGIKVKVLCSTVKYADVWIYSPWGYSKMICYPDGFYNEFTWDGTLQETDPTEDDEEAVEQNISGGFIEPSTSTTSIDSTITSLSIDDTTLTYKTKGGTTTSLTLPVTTYDEATTIESGLMSSTDKAKLDSIEEGATVVSPSTTTPLVAGTATVGTDDGYARGDHVHPAQTTVSGNAGTATKLATSRTIGISGAVTGTATSFNGSANITIPTTSLDASYLTGTASIDTTGNAATATSATSATSATTATKIGSSTIGSSSKPVYISTGTPTAVSSLDATLLSGTASISTTGNASTATKLATARTISLTGDVTGSTTFDGSANKSITTTLADLDASKITSGTLDIARLPSAALERCVVVADDTARFALTTDDVQLGDTVKVTGTAIMYMVTDTDNLDNDDGYTEYAAGTASVALSCTGNAATATQLATSRTINGTSFNGTANITTSKWGTARNISIADSTAANTGTAVSVDGSAAATLKLPATIAADITGNATTATTATNLGTATVGSSIKPIYLNAGVPTAVSSLSLNTTGSAATLTTARTIAISGGATGTATSFNGSANITIPVTSLDASYLTGTADIDTTGNADTATTATKLGSSTIGSSTKPIYLSSGTATASSSTVGGTAKPMYLSSGTMTALSATVGSTDIPVYLSSGTITSTGVSLSSTYKKWRKAIVGQSSSTTTNPYYKFASISTTSTNYDHWITFHVLRGYGDATKQQGILTAHFRMSGTAGKLSSAELVWEYANSGITTDNFIMAYYPDTDNGVFYCELWVKIASSYAFYHFYEIDEGTRTTSVNGTNWTLYSTSSAGSEEEVTEGYTQITSTLATLKNDTSGNAATATTATSATTATTATSATTADSATTATNSTNVYITTTNPTSSTTYYVPFDTTVGSGNTGLKANNGIRYQTLEGTTSANGTSIMILGNSTASGTAANKKGTVRLYNANTGYTDIVGTSSTSNYTITLPAITGTLVTTSGTQTLTNKTYNGYTLAAACAKSVDTSISSSTSTNLPTTAAVVDYIDGLGYVTSDTNYYPTTWTWATGTTSGPTATLAGSGMSSVSVAAIPSASGTTQSGIVTTGAQTFGGVKTFSSAPKLSTNTLTTSSGYTITIPNTAAATLATLATSQALTNKTYNGLTLTAATTGFTIAGGTTSKTLTVSSSYTLAAACAKGVVTSLTSGTTSTNLPTAAAVVDYVDSAVASATGCTTEATSLTCTLPDDL